MQQIIRKRIGTLVVSRASACEPAKKDGLKGDSNSVQYDLGVEIGTTTSGSLSGYKKVWNGGNEVGGEVMRADK